MTLSPLPCVRILSSGRSGPVRWGHGEHRIARPVRMAPAARHPSAAARAVARAALRAHRSSVLPGCNIRSHTGVSGIHHRDGMHHML